MKAEQYTIGKVTIQRIWNKLLQKGSLLLQLKLPVFVNGNTFGLIPCRYDKECFGFTFTLDSGLIHIVRFFSDCSSYSNNWVAQDSM